MHLISWVGEGNLWETVTKMDEDIEIFSTLSRKNNTNVINGKGHGFAVRLLLYKTCPC